LGTLSDGQVAAVRRFEIAAEAFGDQRQLQRLVRGPTAGSGKTFTKEYTEDAETRRRRRLA
jgi:hypothetical protein